MDTKVTKVLLIPKGIVGKVHDVQNKSTAIAKSILDYPRHGNKPLVVMLLIGIYLASHAAVHSGGLLSIPKLAIAINTYALKYKWHI